MIQTGFEQRVQIQEVIENQLPEFILDESPKTAEFLKQYYISQENQGASVDIVENLDQYLDLDNLVSEVIVDASTLSTEISATDTVISVSNTKGFPKKYGLIKIGEEIITYTGLTTTSFTGCVRGFSGVSELHDQDNPEELVFLSSNASSHSSGTKIENLSSLFLKEFYNKVKYSIAPGLQGVSFTKEVNVGTFLKHSKSLYQSKGTEESYRILFNVLFGIEPTIVNLENLLIKPSYAKFDRNEVTLAECINQKNPLKLKGETIYKTSDLETNASISDVEVISVQGKKYYRLSLFTGYGNDNPINGIFEPTSSTKIIENINVGDSLITVDSTVGFPESGVISIIDPDNPNGNMEVSYTGKNLNQFFVNSSDITNSSKKTNLVVSSNTYFGYENGVVSEETKVLLRISNVTSGVESSENKSLSNVGDKIAIKSIGDNISIDEKEYKNLFSNSWIYNSASSNDVKILSNYTLSGTIDRSSFKVGDRVELVERSGIGSEILAPTFDDVFITSISSNKKIPTLSGSFQTKSSDYKLRRKLNHPISNTVPLEYTNILSDIQNLYVDSDNEYAYVASNSLPSGEISGNAFTYRYNIDKELVSRSISSISGIGTDGSIQTGTYNIIKFPTSSEFITGDEVYYEYNVSGLVGLSTGSYYVEVLDNLKKNIKLYSSRHAIGSSNYLIFTPNTQDFGTHNFTLYSQRSKKISPTNILRKFPLKNNLERNIDSREKDSTYTNESTGILINGVEISNYKSNDKIYFGPIESIEVLSSTNDFDVINPPQLEVSASAGTTCKVQPVISGSFTNVFVDPQNFDIDSVSSISVSGGNGQGASFEAVLGNRHRELSFSSEDSTVGGGVNITSNVISFDDPHNLSTGEEIIYQSPSNNLIGTGSTTLTNNGNYFARYINNNSVTLHSSASDAISGIGTVDITSASVGIQYFKTAEFKRNITDIIVVSGGENYTNRKLIVKPSNVSLVENTITFENHGFKTGELVRYSYSDTPISGLSISPHYYVTAVSKDSFRLSNAGVGGTDTTDFELSKYVSFTSTGSGYQYFKYPDIEVIVSYESPNGQGSLVVTPEVNGKIVDCYTYENGTSYGSSVLNLEKTPTITVKNGKDAQLSANITNGVIKSIDIGFGGIEYYSTPKLKAIDSTGSGSGAKLRAIVSNGVITGAKVISGGIGYDPFNTTIEIENSGTNVKFKASIRGLTVNNTSRFGNEVFTDNGNGLQYKVLGYDQKIRDSFGESSAVDTNPKHSPIIGWAYDGNPIYGPFGYSDSMDQTSEITLMSSGYVNQSGNVSDRPSGFDSGFFFEDFKYQPQNGTLDENNGRFTKTPEFPNGVYAYFALVSTSGDPIFPYFIGNTYESKFISDNRLLNQSFDLVSHKILRNSFPHKVFSREGSYDFITKIGDYNNDGITVSSVTSGSVESLDIVSNGNNYRVGDLLQFDNENTSGGGISASVEILKGKTVSKIETLVNSYTDSLIVKENSSNLRIYPNNILSLRSGDNVVVSGLSTVFGQDSVLGKISIDTIPNSVAISSIAAGIGTTELYVSSVPDYVSVGSSVLIGTDYYTLLDIARPENILRIKRSVTPEISIGSTVSFVNHSFTIKANVDKVIDSTPNQQVYFNPTESIGIGTTPGEQYQTTFDYASHNTTLSIPTQSIYLRNHPFKTNQELNYVGTGVFVSTDGINSYNMPNTVYAIKINANHIGIKTTISGDRVFFHTSGSDSDEYLFETKFNQKKCLVEKITTTVTTEEDHNLSEGDSVEIFVDSNLSVGIGTSTSIKVERDSQTGLLVINPLEFEYDDIDNDNDTITINSHGYRTGDRVLYTATTASTGLTDGESYFIYVQDSNKIILCESINGLSNIDTNKVNITNDGSGHKLSLINPQIKVINSNDVVFDTSSLGNYELKFFYDSEFNREFVSTGTTNTHIISSTSNTKTIKFDKDLPPVIFYNLENSGQISTADRESKNNSQIVFESSEYNKNYSISGVGSTTFTFSLTKRPERNSYLKDQCNTLEYRTTNKNASGPVHKVKLTSGGVGYKSLPAYLDTVSSNGSGLSVIPKSDTIGNVKEYEFILSQNEYPSDKTLSPTGKSVQSLTLIDNNTVGIVSITNGGKGYVESPNIVIVDTNTGLKINDGLLEAKLLGGNSISEVNVIQYPNGVPDEGAKLFTTNNTNGVSIIRVDSNSTGIFTCIITTPLNGFSINPFTIGQEVFIEGISKVGTAGSGFNSEDYGFKFFKVENYQIAGSVFGDTVTINLETENISTNTGIANTIQDSFGTIIPKEDYPEFEISTKKTEFNVGEKLILQSSTDDIDAFVVSSNENILRISGQYNPNIGDTLVGSSSGSIASVYQVDTNISRINVSSSRLVERGWSNNTGELNNDGQYLPDNDYYQNLSYSVKSPIEYKELESPVNNIVHISGLKNFADTEILSSKVGTGLSPTSIDETSLIINFIDDLRVDSIYNIDYAKDIETNGTESSKFLKFENLKLSSYIQCIGNEVLDIDDLSDKFSDVESQVNEFSSLYKLDDLNYFDNLLIVIKDGNGQEIQMTEMNILRQNDDKVILEKGNISNASDLDYHSGSERFGTFEIEKNVLGESFLRFRPTDPYNTNYDIKLITSKFLPSFSGIATFNVGHTNIVGFVTSNVSSASTTIVSSEDCESLFAMVQVTDEDTDEKNYIEVYATGIGNTSFIADYYMDTDTTTGSYSQVELVTISGDYDSGTLTLDINNTESRNLSIKTKTLEFGTGTSTSIHRFKVNSDQVDGNERSALYETSYQAPSTDSFKNILTKNKGLFNALKSYVVVEQGNKRSLHQIMMVHDTNNAYIQQTPLMMADIEDLDSEYNDGVTGLGTFSVTLGTTNLILKFHPESTDSYSIKGFHQIFYSDINGIDTQDLVIDSLVESVENKFYDSPNGGRFNKTEFNLTHDGELIFKKIFNPSSVLDRSTGIFTIGSHLFRTGEELIYTPGSNLGADPEGMKVSDGTTLASTVYAIKVSEDTFKIALTYSNALAGVGITFHQSDGYGVGDIHGFEMAKKNEKVLIMIDGLVQYPPVYSRISHQLINNVSIADTIFALSGISSIQNRDILKIGDEYMNVVNVGYGESSDGPITGIGTTALVQVDRSYIGTSTETHSSGDIVYIYRGSYNIVGEKIHFTDPPRGNSSIERTDGYLNFPTSSFDGRVFLKSNYDSNKIYDSISDDFTGIGKTFTLTRSGLNTSGLGTDGGQGLVFVNSMFQDPSTQNNPGGNYIITEETSPSPGITTLTFSGINSINESDVNANSLPRGGIPISFGSTAGLGFAPLVPAVIALTQTGGVIDGITIVDPGSGYYDIPSARVDDATGPGTGGGVTIDSLGPGGSISQVSITPGSQYVDPVCIVEPPSYQNLPVELVFRRDVDSNALSGLGSGMTVNLEVGPAGAGTTLFHVSNFEINSKGYDYKPGDIVRPVGLVTEFGLTSPVHEFEISIERTYTDSFASWEFGEMDYIDSIKDYQNGTRRRFPLFYNGERLSFEGQEDSQLILQNCFLIFINGILQKPGEAYQFTGGTSFIFTDAPKPEDNVAIYFYRGVSSSDTKQEEIFSDVKRGDSIKLLKNPSDINSVDQDNRVIYDISFSDKVETNLYSGPGIEEDNGDDQFKGVVWTKQKFDSKVNGEIVYKSRDSIESQIYPTGHIIRSVSTASTEIYVDDARLFNDDLAGNECSAIIISKPTDDTYANETSDPSPEYEIISGITSAVGFTNEILEIVNTTYNGKYVIEFRIKCSQDEYNQLETGIPVYVSNTTVGDITTSVDNAPTPNTISVGSTCIDNIYELHYISGHDAINEEVTVRCNISAEESGINTTGTVNNPVGYMSYGRIIGTPSITRSSDPISINISGYDLGDTVGLSTFPIIQRRSLGIRATGAIDV